MLGFQVANWSFQTRLQPGAAAADGAAVGCAVGLGEGALVVLVGFGAVLGLAVERDVGAGLGLAVERGVGVALGLVDEGIGVAVVPGRCVGPMVAVGEAVREGPWW